MSLPRLLDEFVDRQRELARLQPLLQPGLRITQFARLWQRREPLRINAFDDRLGGVETGIEKLSVTVAPGAIDWPGKLGVVNSSKRWSRAFTAWPMSRKKTPSEASNQHHPMIMRMKGARTTGRRSQG